MSVAPVTMKITADTSQATEALGVLSKAAQAVTGLKAGWKTSEFWHVVGVLLAAVLTLVFHKDFSGVVQAVAIGGASFAGAVYTISRAHLKRPFNLAAVRYDYQALRPVAGELAHTADTVLGAPAPAQEE